MSEGLLQGHSGNIIKPHSIFLLLQLGQLLCRPFIRQTFATLVVSIGTLSQCPVVDKATTPKGLGKYLFLLIGRIKPVFVGTLLFHALHDSIYCVESLAALSSRPMNGDGYSRTDTIDTKRTHHSCWIFACWEPVA